MPEAKDCFFCKGLGHILTMGMLEKDATKCWMCNGTGKEYDAKKRAIEVQRQDAALTAELAERNRIKTTADKLAFAILHSCDGKCV